MHHHQLHHKRFKCTFGAPSVAYLGHVISDAAVAMDEDKVTVNTWPAPLRRFLGLAEYNRKFIREFSVIATPLTKLLKESFT